MERFGFGVGELAAQPVHDRGIAPLAAKRLHCADPVHGLDELHDHPGDPGAGGPVGVLRAPPVPAGKQAERDEAGQRHQPKGDV